MLANLRWTFGAEDGVTGNRTAALPFEDALSGKPT
jgi:hypothetical protein